MDYYENMQHQLGAQSYEKMNDLKWDGRELMQKVLFYSNDKQLVKVVWMPVTHQD